MSVKQYKKSHIVEAIQFTSTDQVHVDEIIDFVGLPISIEYKVDGSVEMRIIRGQFKVIVAPLNNYIIKHPDGTIETCKPEHFDYEEADE